MAFLESKLRSSDFPYAAMQNMYDANRNADIERQMMMMQLAREKEKMRQERMRTNKLSEERMRGTGDAPKAQDPMAMSAAEQQMYDKYDWLGRPSDAVKAINLVQARGQDPNVARQAGAGILSDMTRAGAQVNAALNSRGGAPMEPDVMSPEYQQQLLANRMGRQQLAGYMSPAEEAEAAQQLAREKAAGYIGSAQASAAGRVDAARETARQKEIANMRKNLTPDRELIAIENADAEWERIAPEKENKLNPDVRQGKRYKQILERERQRQMAEQLREIGSMAGGQMQPQMPMQPQAPMGGDIQTYGGVGGTMTNMPPVQEFLSRLTPEQLDRLNNLPWEEKQKVLARYIGG